MTSRIVSEDPTNPLTPRKARFFIGFRLIGQSLSASHQLIEATSVPVLVGRKHRCEAKRTQRSKAVPAYSEVMNFFVTKKGALTYLKPIQ